MVLVIDDGGGGLTTGTLPPYSAPTPSLPAMVAAIGGESKFYSTQTSEASFGIITLLFALLGGKTPSDEDEENQLMQLMAKVR
jgi:hypothetical protein